MFCSSIKVHLPFPKGHMYNTDLSVVAPSKSKSHFARIDGAVRNDVHSKVAIARRYDLCGNRKTSYMHGNVFRSTQI